MNLKVGDTVQLTQYFLWALQTDSLCTDFDWDINAWQASEYHPYRWPGKSFWESKLTVCEVVTGKKDEIKVRLYQEKDEKSTAMLLLTPYGELAPLGVNRRLTRIQVFKDQS